MAYPPARHPQCRAVAHSGKVLMGASNALAGYGRFAGRVPASSLALLIYMALISKDADAWPFCRLGQHALAEHALGRASPGEADLRAVQRALKPLLDIGAVTVDRAGAQRADGNVTARYRLNLHERADGARRDWESTPDGKRRVSDRRRDPQHPTKNGGDTRRKVTGHPTVSDGTSDENRRPKEPVGDMRSDKTEEEGVEVTPTSHPPRATANDDEPAPVIPLFPKARPEPVPLPAPAFTRRDRIADTLAESAARRAQAVAEHQARLAASKEIS